MKVIILAGGLPSTLIEEDEKMPKPMAEVGGRPLLWHIMKQYSHYGCHDFILCTGYKGEVIKDYFMNFYIYQSDITVDLQTNHVEIHKKQTEDWRVSILDTGLNSSVIQRLYMVKNYIGQEPVLAAYGDCLSDINIRELVEQHNSSDSIATFAVAHPAGRNEILSLNEDGTYEGIKAAGNNEDAWVNACSMVLEPEAFQYFAPDFPSTAPNLMEQLAQERTVQAYRHKGFWSPVETIRDKRWLESLWNQGCAPWKVWGD